MTRNKLDIPQREKAGATTFSKYDFQYHWALYKALSLTKESRDYIVLIEQHEDVVIGDSLDGNLVKYSFNQVKTTAGKYTTQKMVKRTKRKSNILPSVLGKLLSYQTRFEHPEDVVGDYCLVASEGFNVKLKDSKLYQDFYVSDMVDDEARVLSDAIKKELNGTDLPVNLHFLEPKLPSKGFRDNLMGFITNVMSDIFGNSYGAQDVYRTLIDEFHSKGQVALDFRDWETLKNEKGITSITINNVIKKFTDRCPESEVMSRVDDFIAEFQISAIAKGSLRNQISSYIIERVNPGSLFYGFSKEISAILANVLVNNPNEDSLTIITEVWNRSSNLITDFYKSKDTHSFMAAVICEIIYMQKA